MKKFFARAIPWLVLVVLFLVNDEVFSLLMLSVLGLAFVGRIIVERERYYG